MRSLPLYFSLLAIAACADRELAQNAADAAPPISIAVPSAQHDTSPPLTELVAFPAIMHAHDDDDDEGQSLFAQMMSRSNAEDPLAQRTLIAATAPALLVNIEGLGVGMPVGGAYSYPPDTMSAVGATQVMESVNSSIAVWDKTGHLLYGPKWTNTIFAGFGGPCETSNDGDAKISYDVLADRFVLVQFSYFTPPYGLCVAVSATSDATGAWHRYFFQFNSPTDYPSIGVWPDAYYISINGVLTADSLDVPVCAFDRAKMLTGAQATRQCFSTAARGAIPIPANLTGGAAPPTGAPELAIAVDHAGGAALNIWKLHVDWTTPANSTLTGPTALAVAAFTSPQVSVPQPGTTVAVTPGGNAFPVAYRNLGDHESLVLSDEVGSGSIDTVRWYELRLAAGNPTLYQQGTIAPGDGVHRFMCSASIDKLGDIAVGYSVSSTTVYPGIRFSSRLAADPLGQLAQGEGTIINGADSQAGNTRWGDYSAMSVDPVDGCTFWYSQEYIPAGVGGTWATRLAAFRLPGCGGAPPPPPSAIVNGDFETGALTPWTSTGTTSIATTAHAGGFAALAGKVGVTVKGDSAIAQTFTAPTAGGTLTFWYKVVCLDSLTYDWATATLKDNTSGTTTTPLARTCNKTGTWVQVSAPLTASHSYTLTLTSHDDGYSNPDATYTLFDDVAIAGAAPPPPPQPLVNGTFETGALAPWTSTGTTSIATTAHAGTSAALAGKVGVTVKGDSAITQSFTAAATGGTLTFWYKVVCLDSLTYDWATATLKDTTSGTTTTPLARTCNKTGTWVQVSAPLTAGHAYTLTLTSHDDGYSNPDATYTLFDDVAVN